jgi:hypothetical protein
MGPKTPHQPAIPRQGGFSERRMWPTGNKRGFLVRPRREFLIGISAAMLSAPAIVRVGSLMPVRGIVMPFQENYYGF